jgi:hypothetical protein
MTSATSPPMARLLYIKKSVQPLVRSMMLAGGFSACELHATRDRVDDVSATIRLL